MKKRIYVLLLALALCLGLTACGGTGGQGPANTDDGGTPAVTGSGTAPAAAPDAGDGEISQPPAGDPVEEEVHLLTAEEAIAGSAQLASGQCGDSVTWAFYESGALIISGAGDMWDRESDRPWDEFSDDITAVVVEKGVTRLGNYVFARLYALEFLTIPDSVREIGCMVCYNDYKLNSLYLPEGIERIGDLAFGSCSKLERVYIPGSVTSIGGGAFSACDLLTGIYVREGSRHFTSKGGVLFSAGLSTLVQFPGGMRGPYTVPDQVVTLGDGCFRGAENLTAVALPEGLTTIEEDAFYWCHELRQVDIPSSVRSIGEYAFYDCAHLRGAVIPEGVTELPNGLFYGCLGLTEVTIPQSVVFIGKDAFSECISLENVYYGGSEADWSAVQVKDGNGELCGSDYSAQFHCNG